MPLFKCDKCGVVENTALSNYWHTDENEKLCSFCDPEIEHWHKVFPRKLATDEGYLLGNDGFLYHPSPESLKQLKWRIENQGFKLLGPA